MVQIFTETDSILHPLCPDLCYSETTQRSRWKPNISSNTDGLLCGPWKIGQQSPPHSWVPRLIGKIDVVDVCTHHLDCACLIQRLYLNGSAC